MYHTAVNTLFRVGVVGSIVTALCCAGVLTPLLVALLTAAGLGALTRSLDLVLLPALAVFVVLAGVGWWFRQRRSEAVAPPPPVLIRPGPATELVHPVGGRRWRISPLQHVARPEQIHVPRRLAPCADGAGDRLSRRPAGVVEVACTTVRDQCGRFGCSGFVVGRQHGQPHYGGGHVGSGERVEYGFLYRTGTEAAGASGGREQRHQPVPAGGGVEVCPQRLK